MSVKTKIAIFLSFLILLSSMPVQAEGGSSTSGKKDPVPTTKSTITFSENNTKMNIAVDSYLTDPTEKGDLSIRSCDIIIVMDQGKNMNGTNGATREIIIQNIHDLIDNLPNPTRGSGHRIALIGYGRLGKGSNAQDLSGKTTTSHPGNTALQGGNSLATGYYSYSGGKTHFNSALTNDLPDWKESSDSNVAPTLGANVYPASYDAGFMDVDTAKTVCQSDQIMQWYAGASRMDAGLALAEKFVGIAKKYRKGEDATSIKDPEDADRETLMLVISGTPPIQNKGSTYYSRAQASFTVANNVKENGAIIFALGDYHQMMSDGAVDKDKIDTEEIFTETMETITSGDKDNVNQYGETEKRDFYFSSSNSDSPYSYGNVGAAMQHLITSVQNRILGNLGSQDTLNLTTSEAKIESTDITDLQKILENYELNDEKATAKFYRFKEYKEIGDESEAIFKDAEGADPYRVSTDKVRHDKDKDGKETLTFSTLLVPIPSLSVYYYNGKDKPDAYRYTYGEKTHLDIPGHLKYKVTLNEKAENNTNLTVSSETATNVKDILGPRKVLPSKDYEFSITADTGYQLPENIKLEVEPIDKDVKKEVTKGVSTYTYDRVTGKISLKMTSSPGVLNGPLNIVAVPDKKITIGRKTTGDGVTNDAAGGTVTARIDNNDITAIPNEKTATLVATPNESFDFKGWYKSATDFTDAAKQTEDATFSLTYAQAQAADTYYALFTKKVPYVISYDWGNPEWGTTPAGLTKPQHTPGSPYYTEEDALTKAAEEVDTEAVRAWTGKKVTGSKNGKQGVWTFSEWSAPTAADGHDIKITGTWTFTPDEYEVVYQWGATKPSDMTDEKLPKDTGKYNTEAQAKTKVDTTIGNTVNTTSSQNETLQGVWSFGGWGTPVVTKTADQKYTVTYTGNWIFTEDGFFTLKYQWGGDRPADINDTKLPTPRKVYGDAAAAKLLVDTTVTSTLTNETGKTEGTETMVGKWVFNGWGEGLVDNTGRTVTYTGTWAFTETPGGPGPGTVSTSTYTIKYAWGSNVPSDVTNDRLPKSDKKYDTLEKAKAESEIDKTVTNDFSTATSDGDRQGVWLFDGWKNPQVDETTKTVTYIGNWKFRENGFYILKYVWDASKPDDLTATILPNDKKVYGTLDDARAEKDTTVTSAATTSTLKEGKTGTWTFAGWGNGQVDEASKTVTYTGKWRFDETPTPGGTPTPVFRVEYQWPADGEYPEGLEAPVDVNTYPSENEALNAVEDEEEFHKNRTTVTAWKDGVYGVWRFKEWEKEPSVNNTVVFKGKWIFDKKYAVQYSWKDMIHPKSCDLPLDTKPYDTVQDAKDALNNVTEYPKDRTIPGEKGGVLGVWRFKGWGAPEVDANQVVRYMGEWVFEPTGFGMPGGGNPGTGGTTQTPGTGSANPGVQDPNTGEDPVNPGDNNSNPDGEITEKPNPDKSDNNSGDSGDIERVSKNGRATAPRTADPAIFWIWLIGLAVGTAGCRKLREKNKQ